MDCTKAALFILTISCHSCIYFYIKIVTDTGTGPRYVNDRSLQLADGQWHEFDLVRSGPDRFIVRIDRKDIGSGLLYPSDSPSSPSEPLYIAGVPVAVLNNLPAAVSSRKGYTGCLATVSINGRLFDLQRIATFLKPGCSDGMAQSRVPVL